MKSQDSDATGLVAKAGNRTTSHKQVRHCLLPRSYEKTKLPRAIRREKPLSAGKRRPRLAATEFHPIGFQLPRLLLARLSLYFAWPMEMHNSPHGILLSHLCTPIGPKEKCPLAIGWCVWKPVFSILPFGHVLEPVKVSDPCSLQGLGVSSGDLWQKGRDWVSSRRILQLGERCILSSFIPT